MARSRPREPNCLWGCFGPARGGAGFPVEVGLDPATQTLVAGCRRREGGYGGIDNRGAADAANLDRQPRRPPVESRVVCPGKGVASGVADDDADLYAPEVDRVDRTRVGVHVHQRRLDGGNRGTRPDQTDCHTVRDGG